MWYTGTHNQEAIELAEAGLYGAHEGLHLGEAEPLAELRITKALAEGEVADFTTSSTC
jgi:hypothetical protein